MAHHFEVVLGPLITIPDDRTCYTARCSLVPDQGQDADTAARALGVVLAAAHHAAQQKTCRDHEKSLPPSASGAAPDLAEDARSNVPLVSQLMLSTLGADEGPGQNSSKGETAEKDYLAFERVDAKNTEPPAMFISAQDVAHPGDAAQSGQDAAHHAVQFGVSTGDTSTPLPPSCCRAAHSAAATLAKVLAIMLMTAIGLHVTLATDTATAISPTEATKLPGILKMRVAHSVLACSLHPAACLPLEAMLPLASDGVEGGRRETAPSGCITLDMDTSCSRPASFVLASKDWIRDWTSHALTMRHAAESESAMNTDQVDTAAPACPRSTSLVPASSVLVSSVPITPSYVVTSAMCVAHVSATGQAAPVAPVVVIWGVLTQSHKT